MTPTRDVSSDLSSGSWSRDTDVESEHWSTDTPERFEEPPQFVDPRELGQNRFLPLSLLDETHRILNEARHVRQELDASRAEITRMRTERDGLLADISHLRAQRGCQRNARARQTTTADQNDHDVVADQRLTTTSGQGERNVDETPAQVVATAPEEAFRQLPRPPPSPLRPAPRGPVAAALQRLEEHARVQLPHAHPPSTGRLARLRGNLPRLVTGIVPRNVGSGPVNLRNVPEARIEDRPLQAQRATDEAARALLNVLGGGAPQPAHTRRARSLPRLSGSLPTRRFERRNAVSMWNPRVPDVPNPTLQPRQPVHDQLQAPENRGARGFVVLNPGTGDADVDAADTLVDIGREHDRRVDEQQDMRLEQWRRWDTERRVEEGRGLPMLWEEEHTVLEPEPERQHVLLTRVTYFLGQASALPIRRQLRVIIDGMMENNTAYDGFSLRYRRQHLTLMRAMLFLIHRYESESYPTAEPTRQRFAEARAWFEEAWDLFMGSAFPGSWEQLQPGIDTTPREMRRAREASSDMNPDAEEIEEIEQEDGEDEAAFLLRAGRLIGHDLSQYPQTLPPRTPPHLISPGQGERNSEHQNVVNTRRSYSTNELRALRSTAAEALANTIGNTTVEPGRQAHQGLPTR